MSPDDLAATTPPRPRPPTPAPAPPVPLDLDTQIAQLELRLVAREAWIRATAQSLGQRAQQAVTARSWVLPILGGGAVLWLGWRWWHRRTPAQPVVAALPVSAAVHRRDRLADLPWASLVALGWPMLPMAWRGRFSPATATAVVSTGLSIVWWLVGRRGRDTSTSR